ncbi:hypothetical protein H920_12864 [Fukomys damarensis]|uniref:Uncharacterized protein n=1 Tax=Fukomys damarensis TaxID=885580 RepID=A0A091D5J4_FUKDA|nr:hypothetical protein H920_12864 [Fukomys damarensis]
MTGVVVRVAARCHPKEGWFMEHRSVVHLLITASGPVRLPAPPKGKVTVKGECFEWTQDIEAATTVQLKTLRKEDPRGAAESGENHGTSVLTVRALVAVSCAVRITSKLSIHYVPKSCLTVEMTVSFIKDKRFESIQGTVAAMTGPPKEEDSGAAAESSENGRKTGCCGLMPSSAPHLHPGVRTAAPVCQASRHDTALSHFRPPLPALAT